ncbi:hypothetical protein HZS61_001338 [Fusarium oxysporum f. sp. conglutinans]|uniref:Uncharacterized protein n=1 Tax=Fusarium oxysporum f. sp. conglutinans TaxID=100902 RepID=A0A8H6LTG1_FUSOX|nr:hypothetical protein HZS61_001338 [Fusarium oxysporum f. sp. conglutinans]
MGNVPGMMNPLIIGNSWSDQTRSNSTTAKDKYFLQPAPSATPSLDLGSLSSGKICDAGLPAHHLLTSFGCMASQLAAASRSHQATLLTG